MKRTQYTAEFKAEAVKQVVEKGHSVVDVAKRLGFDGHCLRHLYPTRASGSTCDRPSFVWKEVGAHSRLVFERFLAGSHFT
jgi:transposase